MYYLELTDNELKNLAGILGNFIGKNERSLSNMWRRKRLV